MKSPKIALAAWAAFLPTIVAAQAPQTPIATPGADRFLEALAQGDQSAAVRRVLSIESISGRPQPVATPTEFVSRIFSCKVEKSERSGSQFMPLMKIDWLCADGRYRAILVEEVKTPHVVVGEFYDPARLARELDGNGRPTIRTMPPPPPRPPASSPIPLDVTAPETNLATMKRFGRALADGKLGDAGASIGPKARITLGRRDPFEQVTRIEAAGEGPDGFARVLPLARGKLKGRHEADCKVEKYFSICKLGDAAEFGEVLLAMIYLNGKVITRVEIIYATQDSALEDAAG